MFGFKSEESVEAVARKKYYKHNAQERWHFLGFFRSINEKKRDPTQFNGQRWLGLLADSVQK